MRIRTRLFIGTSALVLGLVGVQWWLQVRQLQELEQQLLKLATSMGQNLLTRKLVFKGSSSEIHGKIREEEMHQIVIRTQDESGAAHETPKAAEKAVEIRIEAALDSPDRFLVIQGQSGEESKVPIPVSGSVSVVRATLEQGLIAGGVLLLLGFAGAALVARQVAEPLRRLAEGAEALGAGHLETRVQTDSAGEIGDLERAFNRMGERLAELEEEKRNWLAREHLAELGDLARGLGHGLRNPLHTLGLSVEELVASEPEARQALALTARAQIRRIDRWLRSFLAIGAGRSIEPESIDLATLVQDIVLESVQQGAPIQFEAISEPLVVFGVAPALRSALSNLVANAVEATPAGASVEISVRGEMDSAIVEVADRGAGLPDAVRGSLFSPHVTTKAEGAGMGLFLSRQILESGHGGRLELLDRAGGGTRAVVRLPARELEA